jgi:hypothetical protein
MPLVGFEPTIPVFVLAKSFHVFDRAAAMIGPFLLFFYKTESSKYGARPTC